MSNSFGSIPIEASAPYRPGMLIGQKFVLLRLIAEGAVGAVYEAKDELVQRHVAIKLLHPHLMFNPEAVRRFRREVEATASIQHPNVVAIFEMGQRSDGSFFIVQELLRGEDLRVHLGQRQRFSPDEAVGVMLPVTGALVAAHKNGIVHRDVKPENIVLARSASDELVPKLIDFGLAKVHPGTSTSNLTQVGALLGTASYMSPEQVEGLHPVDMRTDVWAVGAVLYELLSGRPPYVGPTPQSILAKVLTEPAPRIETVAADVPRRLAAIVHRAIERDRAARYPSMQALREDLLTLSGRPTALLSGASAAKAPSGERAAMPLRHADCAGPDAATPGTSRVPATAASAENEVWLDPDDLTFADSVERPLDHDHVTASLREPAQSRRTAAPPSELAWDLDLAMSASAATPGLEAAEHALAVNRLLEAISLADAALCNGAAPIAAGRLLLVQAIAHRWLGNYAASEQCALTAAKHLTRASAPWFAALGHAVIGGGRLGNRKRLLSILEEVKGIEPNERTASPHAILLCRLSIFLLRCGLHNVAQKIYLDAQGLGQQGPVDEPIVRAWLDANRAELDMYRGDLTNHLRRVESSVENFAAAGDLRNSCLQRANIGNAFLQFGAYRRAATVLREALVVAEPMGLDFVATVKANLGFALAQLGELDQGLEITRAALQHGARQTDKRTEAFMRIYLATIHALRGEPRLALASARAAVEGIEGATPIRAYAMGTLGLLLLEQRHTQEAQSAAWEAFSLMNKLNGVEEGESLIRTLYALALHAAGQQSDAWKQLADARTRLLERAERIKDPHWRQSFLERVPDNARLLQLAAQGFHDSLPTAARRAP